MKKHYVSLLGLALLVGCAAPMRTINFDSEPQGARVFMSYGANEDIAQTGRNYLGTTPCSWTTEVNGDGTFKYNHGGIPFYSDFVQSVVVFSCEPPSSKTNLFTKKEVYHGKAAFQDAKKVPDGIFFDLTKQ